MKVIPLPQSPWKENKDNIEKLRPFTKNIHSVQTVSRKFALHNLLHPIPTSNQTKFQRFQATLFIVKNEANLLEMRITEEADFWWA